MDVIELLKSGDVAEIYDNLPEKKEIIAYAEEYKNKHDQRSSQVGKREARTIGEKLVEVNKIPIPFQREIVDTAATFLFGSQLNLSPNGEEANGEAFRALIDTWKQARMDSLLLRFCKIVKSQTEGAIVFYLKGDGKESEIRARVLSLDSGSLHPIFNDFGDMEAFGWSFDSEVDGKSVKNLYFWTAEKQYKFERKGSEWSEAETKDNNFKKIPIVYMNQDKPEWWDVKDLIDRYEMSFSKFCDVNDYFAQPMYKVKGAKGETKISKDNTGRVVNLDIVETESGRIIESDIEVISWDHAPESVKLEFESGKGLIYALSGTPDISFDNVKGIGNITGIALKLMFLSPILKAKNAEGEYQEAVDRMINILKAGLGYTNSQLSKGLEELSVKVQFTSILPDNLQETIQMLTEATGGESIMSQETAIGQNPLVSNAEEEVERIKSEKEDRLGSTEVL